MLSGWSQQAPQLLISSWPSPGEEQTAADQSPRDAAKGAGPPGSQSTWVEVRSAINGRSPGWRRPSLAEAILEGFREEVPCSGL